MRSLMALLKRPIRLFISWYSRCVWGSISKRSPMRTPNLDIDSTCMASCSMRADSFISAARPDVAACFLPASTSKSSRVRTDSSSFRVWYRKSASASTSLRTCTMSLRTLPSEKNFPYAGGISPSTTCPGLSCSINEYSALSLSSSLISACSA